MSLFGGSFSAMCRVDADDVSKLRGQFTVFFAGKATTTDLR